MANLTETLLSQVIEDGAEADRELKARYSEWRTEQAVREAQERSGADEARREAAQEAIDLEIERRRRAAERREAMLQRIERERLIETGEWAPTDEQCPDDTGRFEPAAVAAAVATLTCEIESEPANPRGRWIGAGVGLALAAGIAAALAFAIPAAELDQTAYTKVSLEYSTVATPVEVVAVAMVPAPEAAEEQTAVARSDTRRAERRERRRARSERRSAAIPSEPIARVVRSEPNLDLDNVDLFSRGSE